MKKFKFAVLCLAVVTLTAFTIADSEKGYEIGSVETDFKLKNIDNKMVSLRDLGETKGYIVIFTCNHCPYAVAY